MVPLVPSSSPNGVNPNCTNILFVHQGEYEGQYVFLNVDTFGNTELYESPSTSRDSGRDGFPSQSFFPKGEEDSITELIRLSDAELVDPRAWGKWEYFFGISQVSETTMTNSLMLGNRDVYQPIRDDHFRLFLGLFDDSFLVHPPAGIQFRNSASLGKRKSRNVYVEFIRLYLLAKGLAIYAAPERAEVVWFSDNYRGIHSLPAESLVSEVGRTGAQGDPSKTRFLNTWVEAEPVRSDWATQNLFDCNLLSERSFSDWFESSPIHRMRLGLGYFEKFRVVSESFDYLTYLFGKKYVTMNGESLNLSVSPWLGRTIMLKNN